MDARLNAIIQHGDQLFDKRSSLLSLWQMLAEEFYIERADFTTVRNIGEEMGKNLMSSYPVMARRDLGNSLAAMLRPTAKEWFKIETNQPDREDTAAKQWLEHAGKMMRNMMRDRRAQFSRATKEGDHDFATFGQCVVSTEMNRDRNGVLYRCWHLRDVAWVENNEGAVATVHRKWKPTARELSQLFPKTLHENVRKKLEKEPYSEVNVRHVVMPADEYAELPGAKAMRTPYVSLYIDVDNNHEMECTGSWTRIYNIPRWQTVSGSQYAHSPASIAALADARLIQAMTLTLLTAGEKAVDPPLVAVKEAIRGDVAIYPGGITWVDAEYDERLGEVLRPMTVDKSGINFGLDFVQDLRAQLKDAWYISKLNLPPVTGREMTAYEVGQRVQEFIRDTLPLFEPMEADYNGGLCEDTFELMIRNSPELRAQIPDSIRGADIRFSFESPLHEAIERAKVGQLSEAQQILAMAMQLDPGAINIVDGQEAVRDTLTAVVPAKWLRDKQQVTDMLAQQAAQQQAQQALEMMQGGADVAKTLAESGVGKSAPVR